MIFLLAVARQLAWMLLTSNDVIGATWCLSTGRPTRRTRVRDSAMIAERLMAKAGVVVLKINHAYGIHC